MDRKEDLSGKRALMDAAACRIADKQQMVIDEFEASISSRIATSPVEQSRAVRDFLIEDD